MRDLKGHRHERHAFGKPASRGPQAHGKASITCRVLGRFGICDGRAIRSVALNAGRIGSRSANYLARESVTYPLQTEPGVKLALPI